MSENFFADYNKFVVLPDEQLKSLNKEYDPLDFVSHHIITMTLYDALLQQWSEAAKFEVDVEKSISAVLKEFNFRHKHTYHLKLLELDLSKSYFVLALSSKEKLENKEADSKIKYIIEKLLTNPFYIGQSWYKFIGERGRIERKLFCFSSKEYRI
ncbi:hypothetical protein [Peribacillus sp. SCS-155]|uniref:hypothetical protein n=1 Tax=Peribacillus sedimenti TaxID=3115297 RepID=UPI00390611B1